MDVDSRRAMIGRALEQLEIETTPDELAATLAQLEAAVKLTYEQPTPSLAGLAWIRALQRSGPRLEPEAVTLPDPAPRAAFNLTDPAQARRRGQLVQVDVNASFANAAQSLELGAGDPISVISPTRSDLNRPGWVTVANPSPDWPAPFGRLTPGEQLWTPLARLLVDTVPAAELVDAVVWPQHRRWLRFFARRMLDARGRLIEAPGRPAALALVLVKQVYSKTLGGMLNAPHHNHTAYLRPDWAWMIKAGAAASMWRQLRQLDPGPAAVLAPDAALFILPAGELPALEMSTQPGKWKLERRSRITAPMRQAITEGKPLTLIQATKRAK